MKTILQVEDDPNDVFFLQRAMKKMGLANSVQVASDGRQAIDYFQGAGKFADRDAFPLPCVVLLDLKLPYVMGLEVLRWIRKNCGPTLPVIILTASAEDADIAAAYCLGASAFLIKPSESSKLEEMVKAIGDFWLKHNTVPEEPFLPHLRAGEVPPVHSSTTDSAQGRHPRVNGMRRGTRPHEVGASK